MQMMIASQHKCEEKGIKTNHDKQYRKRTIYHQAEMLKIDYQESYATRNLTVNFRYMYHGTP